MLVTGGNRGLGFACCRQLADAGWRVLLASRDAHAGECAAAAIRETKPGAEVQAEALDVADDASAAALGERLAKVSCWLDALVNNAGVSLGALDADVARRTLRVNVHGPRAVLAAVEPRLRDGARVVNVSSGMGTLSMYSAAIRARFVDEGLSSEALDALLDEFVEAVARGSHAADGWPSSAYRVSKAGLNALTRIQAAALPRLLVNAVCPGWVRTDMGGAGADRDVDTGARSILYGVTGVADGQTGGFYRDGQPADW